MEVFQSRLSYYNLLLDQHLSLRSRRNNHTTRVRPRISIEASSLLGYLFFGKPFLSPARAVLFVAASRFAERGVAVILDADGPNRHHSKRAHQNRVAQRDRLRIQLLEDRTTLANLINNPNQTNIIVKQQEEALSKKNRRKEGAQQRGLPPHFVDKIDDLVKSFESTNGSHIVLQKSLWQANPAIAKRAIDGDVDAVLSGDSDFAMYVLGNDGPDGCILQPKVQESIFPSDLLYPIFDGLH